MAYEVLARKWRPQLFEDVVGQEHITRTLINAIKSDRLAHAYLFGGPRGVGKTSVARILAKAINCEKGEAGIPCNTCRTCIEITEGSSVDVQEIDGASNRGIDEIRELRESIRYMPSSSKYRIYIIDEVHMLTLPAFNALLKTLEEPPGHVKFIFATTEPHKVPVTILSRCQRFDFKRIPVAQIVAHLGKIAEEENLLISATGLALLARESEGSMRDAESLLDQVISFTGSEVQDAQVREILGIIDRDIMCEASRAIIEGSAEKCFALVEQIYTYGYDIKEFYRALMDQFRNLLVSLIASQEYLLEISDAEKDEIRRQAATAGAEKLQALLNLLITREEDLRFTSNPRVLLETTMVRLCRLDDFLSFGDLIAKVESLEKRLITAARTQAGTTVEHLSDPAAQWSRSEPERGLERQVPAAAAGDESWEGFLAFLSSKNKPFFNILKDWHLHRLGRKRIEIAKGSHPFSSTYFDDKEQYAKLSAYCRQFFGREITIEIVDRAAPRPSVNPGPGDTMVRPGAEEQAPLPPPVQDILQMFNGELTGSTASGDKSANRTGGPAAKNQEELA